MNTKPKLAISLAILIILSSQFVGCTVARTKQVAPQKPCPATGCPAPARKY